MSPTKKQTSKWGQAPFSHSSYYPRSPYLPQSQALSCLCSCLAAWAGVGNSKLPYRCQGLLQREGRALAVIGSQDQSWEQGHFICRCWGREEGGGWGEGGCGCICQGQALWKKPGSYPIELCSPLCSLLVSYAAHSVSRLSRLCLFCCGKGIPDQHLKGIITGRTGAGLLNLQCISNSWGVRGPSEGAKHVDQMPLCDFLVETNRDHCLERGISSGGECLTKKKKICGSDKCDGIKRNFVSRSRLDCSSFLPRCLVSKTGRRAIILCWTYVRCTEVGCFQVTWWWVEKRLAWCCVIWK